MKIIEKIPVMGYTNLSIALSTVGILLMVAGIILLLKKVSARKWHFETFSDVLKVRGFLPLYLLGMAIAILSIQKITPFYTETGKMQYKCEMNDISVSEVTEKYDIISMEDNIWIIQPK